MLPCKIVKNNKIICLTSIQYYLQLFCCGLYTMAIDVVTWRIIKKWCIWSLHLHNFLWLPVFELFLQKLRRLSRNYLNFIYIYKIEIRNIFAEVSVSSTMVATQICQRQTVDPKKENPYWSGDSWLNISPEWLNKLLSFSNLWKLCLEDTI